MNPPSRAFLAILLATGCSSGAGVEYDLNLIPITPGNQSPFTDLDRLTLTLEPAAGASQSFDLAAVTGSPQVLNLGPLEETRVAIEGYIGDDLVTFGRSTPITIDSDTYTENVLVSDVDSFGWLNVMVDGVTHGAAAPDGAGSFYLFGGSSGLNSRGEHVYDSIISLTVAPPNDSLAFEELNVSMPEYQSDYSEETQSERMGHTATLLTGTGPNAGQILIAGGLAAPYDLSTTTYAASLFDPVTQEFTEIRDGMASSRAHHLAVVNNQGDVVMIGGWGSTDPDHLVTRDSAEVYNRASGAFESISGGLPGDGLYAGAASLGADGVLVCGGAELLGGTWAAVDDCVIITVANTIVPVESLPERLSNLAMVSIGEGKVLATGGLQVDPSDNLALQFASIDASRSAYVYDSRSDSWTQVDDMAFPRAYHAATPLPGGRALIIGGAMRGELFYADASDDGGPGLACVEIFNPDGSFELLDDCSESSGTSTLPTRNHWPTVAVDPVYGTLVVGGTGTDIKGLASASLWVSAPEGR